MREVTVRYYKSGFFVVDSFGQFVTVRFIEDRAEITSMMEEDDVPQVFLGVRTGVEEKVFELMGMYE